MPFPVASQNDRYLCLVCLSFVCAWAGAAGFLLNFAALWCVSATSATTYAVVNTVNNVRIDHTLYYYQDYNEYSVVYYCARFVYQMQRSTKTLLGSLGSSYFCAMPLTTVCSTILLPFREELLQHSSCRVLKSRKHTHNFMAPLHFSAVNINTIRSYVYTLTIL